jgi:peptidoglycan/xylan/chitin deacetylase (PgdA/CDA1 family)
MSFLVLMYHRAQPGRHGNSAEMLDAHFDYVASNFPNVLPGEALAASTLNVCLSFDDGYFDFYAIVFPLLKKYRLRALLAIPPAVVREHVDAPRNQRLGLDADTAFANPDSGGFCTWPELAEMAESGHVSIAAHGLTHCRLDSLTADLDSEIVKPKAVLSTRIGRPVENFVFPFGRYGAGALYEAQRNYRHVLRIGGAINHSSQRQLLYRVDADKMTGPQALFTPGRLALYRARYVWNRLRAR